MHSEKDLSDENASNLSKKSMPMDIHCDQYESSRPFIRNLTMWYDNCKPLNKNIDETSSVN